MWDWFFFLESSICFCRSLNLFFCLSFEDLKHVIRKTTQTTAYIFALFVGATMFALILRGLGGDELIEGALKALPFGTNGVVIVVLLIELSGHGIFASLFRLLNSVN